MLRDLPRACRLLVANRSFAGIAIATLALGIGANAAMFSLVAGLLLQPLPYPAAERIVLVTRSSGQGFVTFGPDGFEISPDSLRESRSFRGVGLYEVGGANLGVDPPQRVSAAAVTPGFFEALAVTPARGRVFTRADLARTRDVALVSDRLWKARFGGDPGTVGRTVPIDGRAITIIGVMPPRATFPGMTDLWLPSGTGVRIAGPVASLTLIARLAPGTTPAAVRDEAVRAIASPQSSGAPARAASVSVVALREALTGDIRRVVWIAALASVLVLLIACFNVVNLLLSRMTARAGEFAIRSALGASRGQLAAQVASETVVLVCGAAAAALPVALWTLEIARAFVPATLHGADAVTLDPRAVAAASGVAVVTVALFGGAPALSPRVDRLSSVPPAARATSDPLWLRIRSGLMVLEIAMAIVLVSGALSAVRAVARLMDIDVGFRGERALTFDLTLPTASYGSSARAREFYARLDHELRGLAGVEQVGATNELPGQAADRIVVRGIEVQGVPVPDGPLPSALALSASPGYFTAVGIDLLAGRPFSDADGPGSPPVAIVSEGYVRALGLTPQAVVGERANVAWKLQPPVWAEIVGVVADVRLRGPEDVLSTACYVPFRTEPTSLGPMHVVVKGAGDPRDLIPAIRAAVSRVDPGLPLYNIHTFAEIRARDLGDRRFARAALIAFAALASALGALGLYGVISYLVQLRVRDIGIRLAVGAPPSRVRRLVLASGARHACIGIALGLASAIAVARIVAARVPGLERPDSATLAWLSVATLLVALAASWFPARRATRVDPLTILRAE